MNDKELQENFYEACYHYAKTIGPAPDVKFYDSADDFVVIFSDNNGARIGIWNHTSTEPTDTQLKKYTVKEVQDSWNLFLKSNLSKYPLNESGTIILTLRGPWDSDQDINIGYIANNNTITMNLQTLSIISNSSGGAIVATSAVKLLLRPNTTTYFQITVEDNGNNQIGILEFNSSGIISIYADINLNNFSNNSGNYGFKNTHINYCL